jgi:hypothetical protein
MSAGENKDRREWQTVLDAMYVGDYVTQAGRGSEYRYSVSDEFLEKTGLDREEMEKSLTYLDDTGLLGLVDDGHIIGLSTEGLKVAHEREITRENREQSRQFQSRQASINLALLLATTVLAITAILSVWPPFGMDLGHIILNSGPIWLGLAAVLYFIVRLVAEYIRLELDIIET